MNSFFKEIKTVREVILCFCLVVEKSFILEVMLSYSIDKSLRKTALTDVYKMKKMMHSVTVYMLPIIIY